MSNHSVIEHRACYHFVKAEEDYIAVCSSGKCSPHCKALILAVLESWANTKGKNEYVYMSLPQWIQSTYMFYERNVIIDCIQELLEEKFIDRRQVIVNDQKTFEYKLNVEVVQSLIKELPAKENENLPNLNKYLDFKKRMKTERMEKKAKAVEKSTTHQIEEGAVEKNTTVVEKNTTHVEKSTATEHEGSLIFQPILDSNYLDTHLDNNIDITDTAHADVSPPQKPPVENKEKTKISKTDTQNQAEVKETTCRSKTGKNKQLKKEEIKALLSASEIAAPEKPDPTIHSYNVELLMMLADYYRGSELPMSSDPRSRYQKALHAAMSYIQRRIPFEHIDKLFCFMLGRGEEIGLPDLKDVKWIEGGYNTDLWTVESNHTSKWLECQKIEQQLRMTLHTSSIQSERLPQESLPDDESILVAWTCRGDWDGDPVEHWDQFELMTMKDAKQYGWKPDTFPRVTHNRIRAKLRQRVVPHSVLA